MTQAYSGPSQVSKMECFAKIVNSWKSLTIFAKRSILDAWQGSEYAPGRQVKANVLYCENQVFYSFNNNSKSKQN